MIKFKIKTPKNYIEILKSISKNKYHLKEPEYAPYLFLLIATINIIFISLLAQTIFSNEASKAIFLFTSFIIEVYLFFYLIKKYLKEEKKQMRKRFFKIFNIEKEEEKIIEFLKENIDFIEDLDLSNKELINLINKYKNHKNNIKEIKKENKKLLNKISNLEIKRRELFSYKMNELKTKI